MSLVLTQFARFESGRRRVSQTGRVVSLSLFCLLLSLNSFFLHFGTTRFIMEFTHDRMMDWLGRSLFPFSPIGDAMLDSDLPSSALFPFALPSPSSRNPTYQRQNPPAHDVRRYDSRRSTCVGTNLVGSGDSSLSIRSPPFPRPLDLKLVVVAVKGRRRRSPSGLRIRTSCEAGR